LDLFSNEEIFRIFFIFDWHPLLFSVESHYFPHRS
jgi:hypothetical protein